MNERRRTEQCIRIQKDRARIIRQQLEANKGDFEGSLEMAIPRALMEERLREIRDRLSDLYFILGLPPEYDDEHAAEEPDRGGAPKAPST